MEEAVLQLGQLAAGRLQVPGITCGTASAGQKALAEQLGRHLLGSLHGSAEMLAQASCQHQADTYSLTVKAARHVGVSSALWRHEIPSQPRLEWSG